MPHPTLCPAGETGASTSRLGAEVHTNGPQLDDRILADADVQVGWLSRAASGCTCWNRARWLLQSLGMCAPMQLLAQLALWAPLHTLPSEACHSPAPLAPPLPHLLIQFRIQCDRLQACISNASSATKEYEIVNVDRSALGRVGGAIARKYGDSGFTGTLTVSLAVMLPQVKGERLDRHVDGRACSTNALPLQAALPAARCSASLPATTAHPPALTPHLPASPPSAAQPARLCGPVLCLLPGQRHGGAPGGRGQRLRGQGHGRRRRDHCAAPW